jgi:hypothetical protein
MRIFERALTQTLILAGATGLVVIRYRPPYRTVLLRHRLQLGSKRAMLRILVPIQESLKWKQQYHLGLLLHKILS